MDVKGFIQDLADEGLAFLIVGSYIAGQWTGKDLMPTELVTLVLGNWFRKTASK